MIKLSIKARSKKKRDPIVPRRRRLDDETPTTPVNPQFRRNQTLSSYRHNTPEESSRQKVHHLALQRRKVGGLFIVVASVAALLMLLLWQLTAQVHITTSTKPLSVPFDASQYEKSINDYFAVNPAQRLRFALDESKLSEFVSAQLPEVESLTMTGAPALAQTNFTITFRQPVAGWIINGKQYYVDSNGVVFQKNYYVSPGVEIVDESGAAPTQGTTVAGGRLLGFLGRVVAQAGERGYTVTKAILPQGTTREVDIYLNGVSTRVKLNIDRGAGEQIEDMTRALKYLTSQGVTAEYLDVRVSGRAAHK